MPGKTVGQQGKLEIGKARRSQAQALSQGVPPGCTGLTRKPRDGVDVDEVNAMNPKTLDCAIDLLEGLLAANDALHVVGTRSWPPMLAMPKPQSLSAERKVSFRCRASVPMNRPADRPNRR